MGKVQFDFSGDRFVITGASSGFGRQIALDLAHSGAEVLAIARNIERLDEVRGHYPERIVTASLDVCDADALENAIKEFVGARGKLNGGVHAAGIGGMTSLRNFDRDLAHKIMQTSFWAAVDFIKLVTKSKYGAVGTSTVLFSSIAALGNFRGKFAYSTSKAAVCNLVKVLAKEINGKKHRVNSVLPGLIDTPMIKASLSNLNETRDKTLLGEGAPSDVSGMVMFLLSDAARWITGSNIVIDGGASA